MADYKYYMLPISNLMFDELRCCFIVLLLSDYHGSLGNFQLLTVVTEGRYVSLLQCLFFFSGIVFGLFC